MNTTKTLIGIAFLAIVTFITACNQAPSDRSKYNQTFFPTNHWEVVGHGTNSEVVVETKSTNMVEYLRVHRATAVTPLTNGQPVRVEMVVRWEPSIGKVRLINSKAYPAME